jgi:ATP-binding cassette, subfamily B, bacterial
MAGPRRFVRPPPTEPRRYADVAGLLLYTRRALELVWAASPRTSVLFGTLSVVAGVLPAAVAYVGKLIVDAVVHAAETGALADRDTALGYVGIELGLVALLAAVTRGLAVCDQLLRALLGQRVNEMILEKALTLELADFEDSEFYDKMQRARREASSRPLSLVRRAFSLGQNTISLVAYGALLLGFSPWMVLVLVLAAIPSFVIETRFSEDAFRLFRWRAPEARQQMYLETVLSREDYAKEVKLFELGPLLLGRFRSIFGRLFAEDRALALRRGFWGFALGLLSSAAFYGAYAWIVVNTVRGSITLGAMTMYLLVFKQGQSALAALLSAVGGMYEDKLYLSNLYEYLEHGSTRAGNEGRTVGPEPGAGLVFDRVTFSYPGAERPALEDVSFEVRPGQKLALVGENGAGKTTLVKLLSRLYSPSSGRILLDGLDLREWDASALRQRVGIIFQDFVRYQLLAGENIGVGDVQALEEEPRWELAAEKGMASDFMHKLPLGYRTQLGGWFKDGQELSLGQWQKIALSRAFMRSRADILVLDEPTASMDAAAEARVFQRFRELTAGKMAILISHRFSTVRMADRIVVIEDGRVTEHGSHAELLAQKGKYARLFELQAEGYR